MAYNVGINANEREEARRSTAANSGSRSSGGGGGITVGVKRPTSTGGGVKESMSQAVQNGLSSFGRTVNNAFASSFGGGGGGGGGSSSSSYAAPSYGGGGGGGDNGAAAPAAAAAAAAAERQRKLEEERRRQANEQKRRDDAARNAQQQQEQAKKSAAQRQSQKTPQAASVATKQQAKKNDQKAAKNGGVPKLSTDEVAVANSEQRMERAARPATSENLGFVDTETGELVNTTPERAAVPAKKAAKKRSSKKKEAATKPRPSRIAEMVNGGAVRVSKKDMLDSISEYEANKSRIKAQRNAANEDQMALQDLLDALDVAEREEALEALAEAQQQGQPLGPVIERIKAAHLASGKHMKETVSNYGRSKHGVMTESDYTNSKHAKESDYWGSGHRLSDEDMLEARSQYFNELAAERGIEQGEHVGQTREYDKDNSVEISQQDVTWRLWQDVTGINGERAQKKKIIENENDRQSLKYKEYVGENGQKNTNFDAADRGFSDYNFDDETNESGVVRIMRNIQDMMYKRFLNPSLVRIENEFIETEIEMVKGKKKTYARLRYSDRVEGAINAVRRTYNCSIYNALQLIQLRAGLGIDIKGKIGNVNPDEFKLTEDQVIELCRDICKSQEVNGHPLGLVDGTPGAHGVRDDTGRFVVVAGTRCFPMGYMPKQLMKDLSKDWNSPLHNLTPSAIDALIGNQWINETYPILCANTGGNLMYQARAIENMMRGLMRADGVDPGKRDIPEIVERETLLALRSEAAAATDPDIKEAIELRQQADEESLSRWRHRRAKRNGTRQNGSIKSVSESSWNRKMEQAFSTFSNLQRMAGATHIAIMISSVPESIMAEGGMSVANLMSDAWFKAWNKETAANYQFTEDLRTMAESREAVEARSVAESLYRIGGLDAMRAFLSELGDDGRAKYRLTNADFRTFLQEYGFINLDGEAKKFVKPGQEAAFKMNVQHVLDTIEDLTLGSSNMFKTREARQFVQMSMAEMGQASLHGRESYNTEQVTDWGLRGGGEELVRSLLKTDAGIEAFMTQGITSLGRKSPVEHQMRVALAKNGFCEFMVRNLFDRYIEYGVNKFISQIPMSNTISYLVSRGIKSYGDFLAEESSIGAMPLGGVPNMANAMQRNFDYQVGSRLSFKEGLLKNLRYDMVMAGGQLGKALVVYGILMHLGGIYPPEDERDKYTLSEWKIGDPETGIPIKFAWWMDDMAGTGLPLGFAFAICEQGKWSPDALDVAAKCFTDQVANFNDGTAVFDAIELVMNPQDHINKFLGLNVEGYNPDFGEWANSFVEQKFWDLVGSITPAAIGELVPWSRDYLFKGDADAHTPYKVFDAGGRYSMDEAQSEYRVKSAGSYSEVMRRRSSQSNILQALFYDFWNGPNDTSYKYGEMPLDTMTDPMAQRTYDMFKIDVDNLPLDQNERIDLLRGNGMAVIEYVDNNFENAAQANAGAFVLDFAARKNAEYWCRQMIKEAKQNFEDTLKNGRLPNDEYYTLKQERDDLVDHYYWLIDEFFTNEDIPWRVPRYVRQESDYETRYVDEEGNPMTFLDTLAGNAKAERYLYGNVPSLAPISSPRTAGKGHNFETIPYWVVLDDEGNPVNDMQSMYDLAGQMGPIEEGRNAGKSVQNLMWGGQGTNMYGSGELQAIAPGGIPTLGGGAGTSGGRPWRIMEDFLPDSMKNMSAADLLGLPPLDEEEKEEPTDSSSGGYGGYGGYSRSYYPRYYSSYGRSGGGGYYGGGYTSYSGSGSPEYNPKIYSNPRQVYSTRAAGLNIRAPYKATNTYLRPAFYTKGSREAYRRQDF